MVAVTVLPMIQPAICSRCGRINERIFGLCGWCDIDRFPPRHSPLMSDRHNRGRGAKSSRMHRGKVRLPLQGFLSGRVGGL